MSALDDLVTALQTARTSAFRLEQHQDYADDELWQAHLRGEPWEDSDDLAQWCALVSGNADRGVTMTRVRVVVEPWTPYTRWEVEEHFPHNLRAGEDVRLLNQPVPSARTDFHLIDDERAWLLEYNRSGVMTVVEASERTLPLLRERRDEALAHSTPWSAAFA